MKSIGSVGLLAIFVGTLSACATPPDKVQPLTVSTSEYDGMNCTQLAKSEEIWLKKETELTAQQKKARTGDTVGVILIGVPTGSLSGGDVETQLAHAKGHVQAIQSVIVRKSC